MDHPKEIEASDAEQSFAAVLELVEQGREVSITRDGREIARLVPSRRSVDPEQARAAVRRIRERAAKAKLGITLEEALAWRDEGRR